MTVMLFLFQKHVQREGTSFIKKTRMNWVENILFPCRPISVIGYALTKMYKRGHTINIVLNLNTNTTFIFLNLILNISSKARQKKLLYLQTV